MALRFDKNVQADDAHHCQMPSCPGIQRPCGTELQTLISQMPATLPPGVKLELVNAKSVILTDCFTHAISTGQLGPEDQFCELLILGNCRSRTEGFFLLPSVLYLTPQ